MLLYEVLFWGWGAKQGTVIFVKQWVMRWEMPTCKRFIGNLYHDEKH